MSQSFSSSRPAATAPPPLDRIEKIAVVHVCALLVLVAWAFGGNAPWSRILTASWGSLGLLITWAIVRDPQARKDGRLTPLRWLWPLGIFNLLVVASVFNPSFRELSDGVNKFYVPIPSFTHLPGTARPRLSLHELWFFDAVYLACFNLLLAIRHRRAMRYLLLGAAANAVLLAIYGTVQKLLGAEQIYFAEGKAVQPYFFSSFIYHNHWGAFTVLMIAICLGLVFHFARRSRSRDFWHSPGFGGLIAIALLVITIPLSGSRSCTVLSALFLLGAFLNWVFRFTHERRRGGASVALPVAAVSIAFIAAGYFAYDLARPMIEKRLANTQVDIETLRANPAASTRLKLYRDTWLMAQERPWFGWGMASYPTVFYLRNSQRYPIPNLPNQVHFHDAHCDWLQSLSEVGFIGTALLGLCALVPLYHRRRRLLQSPVTTYLLAGVGLILLYAWLEFPFGNGAVIVAFWVCFFSAVHYPHCETARDMS